MNRAIPNAKSRAHANDGARASLLRCALSVLEEDGHEALSVRRVADLAGVTSGAPYYHFEDKRGLLVGLALEGFDLLMERSQAALHSEPLQARQALDRLSAVFLDFSAERPRLVDLMYESDLTRPVDTALRPAYRRAFDLVESTIAKANPASKPSAVAVRAASFWASLFGLSRLLRHQLLEPFGEAGIDDWRSALVEEIVLLCLGEASSQSRNQEGHGVAP